MAGKVWAHARSDESQETSSLMKVEIQQFAVWLAQWPPKTDVWLLNPTWEEIAFQKQHGIARLIAVLKPESARLSPILRLSLARNPDLTDSDVEATRKDVVRHIQTCLDDETYTDRDLAASMLAAPRELAIWLIRSLKEAENRLEKAEKEPESAPQTPRMVNLHRESRKTGSMPSLPDDIRVVGPDSPQMGYLQLCREGTERTLCDLPLQPHWSLRLPEEFGRYTFCRQCAKILEREP